ncbi:hypothetical protein GCM10010358_83110 [Streptomyces minutiscleroticus]|uniref:Uncharacterized protein n=1 Tax=Streptomyces minutiscleroticus TaxID=68238 RepID=A0A918P4W8_9ACTN|nr:hypothetical protein GCM10010358_83110 [Streptomyces minutiscleroticus]
MGGTSGSESRVVVAETDKRSKGVAAVGGWLRRPGLKGRSAQAPPRVGMRLPVARGAVL